MLASVRTLAMCAAAAAAFALAMPAQAYTKGGYHIMPTAKYMAKLKHQGVPPPAEVVNYYGGSVFTAPKMISVMWGSGVNSTIVSTVPGFSAAIVNSTYVDQASAEYSTKHKHAINGHKGTKQTIGRGTYLGQTVITPNNTNTNLSDEDVQAEIKLQISQGNLPKQDLNTLYMVYFPQNVTITLDGLVSCQDFGAYHFATNDKKLAKKNLFYAVEPDCNSGINFITFAASHEFMEATTDNVPTPGSFPDFPQAWNDANGFEIADLCSGSGQLTAGSSHWNVTQYFLNSTGKCSTGNYTSP
jgi:hypothetical protein